MRGGKYRLSLLLAVAVLAPAFGQSRPTTPVKPATAPIPASREAALAIEFDPAASFENKEAAWKAYYRAALARNGGALDAAAASAVPYLVNNSTGESNPADEVALLQRAVTVLAPVRDRHAPEYAMAVGLIAYRQAQLLGKPNNALAALDKTDSWYAAYLAALPEAQRSPEALNAQARLAFGYGKTMAQLGRYKEAAAYQQLNWESVARARGPFSSYANSAEQAYAVALYLAGRGDDAERVARDAAENAVAHFAPDDAQIATAFGTVSQILVRGGKRFEALDYMRRAIDVSRAANGADDTRYFATVYALGDVLTALERYREADAALLEAAHGFERAEGKTSRATLSLARAGIVELGAGEPRRAAGSLEAAFTAARAIDTKEQAIGPVVLPSMILALHDVGELSDARRFAEQYRRENASIGEPFPIERAQGELLPLYLAPDGGKSDAARAGARRIIEIVRSKRDLAASGQLPQGDRTALELVLRVAAAANDGQLALDAMVILTGSKVAQASRLLAERITSGDPKLAGRIREFQDATQAFQTADKAALAALAKGVGVAEAQQRLADTRQTAERLREGLVRDYPQWAETRGIDAVAIGDLRNRLAKDEAMFAVVPAFDGVYTLLVTREAARVRRVALPRQQLADLVTRLRVSLPTGAIDRQAAATLYAQLFLASDSGMLAAKRSLRIVPGGIFAALPFDVLLQRPSPSGAAAPWLIRRFAISVSPSFLPTVGAGLRDATANTFLGVGAPTPFGNSRAAAMLPARRYFRGGGIDIKALADLPNLPGSAAEVANVARYFGPAGTTTLVGDDASEHRLKTMDLRRFSTILFSTHGLVSGEIEGVAEPALVLARPAAGSSDDGLLAASEIALLRLDADWVILSACNTAAGDGGETPAYSGLAQAFRYAGARSLLLSHWAIRDDAARFVTVETIANARRGMRRDVALQQAMLKLMESRLPGASDPYIWAPFMLLGDAVGPPARR